MCICLCNNNRLHKYIFIFSDDREKAFFNYSVLYLMPKLIEYFKMFDQVLNLSREKALNAVQAGKSIQPISQKQGAIYQNKSEHPNQFCNLS